MTEKQRKSSTQRPARQKQAVKARAAGSADIAGGVPEVDGQLMGEYIQQLSGSGPLIYNARHEDVTLIVENLGYGDVYASGSDDVKTGNESQRMLFKEQRAFRTRKLFLDSASQPVISILEIKQ
ncbi:hypothetical protein [Paenibacillus tengchongensis]|uniref:hypothetical protein n=1 Tax=Paenibacillus tengchongensis TaxID=2608684 RepID=UPI00124D31AB|nr:hypothetical protein [Paenibacillus tengchongensis]